MALLLAAATTAGVALASSGALLAHVDRRPAVVPPSSSASDLDVPVDGTADRDDALPAAHREDEGAPVERETARGADVSGAGAPEQQAGAWRALWWIPVVSVGVAVVLAYLWATPDLELVYQVRVVLFLSFLPALAVIDHRERIVPNQILLVLLALRVPLWIWEALVDVDVFLATLRAEAAMALVIFGFFFLMRAVHRGGLGMGDVKLFALMPLFLGTQLALSAILGALVAAFAFAVWSLATRRKGRKDTFAMVPAIAVGAILAVLAVSIRGAL